MRNAASRHQEKATPRFEAAASHQLCPNKPGHHHEAHKGKHHHASDNWFAIADQDG
jgi:hypothetical protein